MSARRITRISAAELRRQTRDRTDWKRIDSLTDREIEAAMRSDPDWADLLNVDWSDAVIVTPKRKRSVSIRLDDDVIEYFKSQGEGYQTRMNAVLRHFMSKTKKRDAAE